jgi:hypothetical protein
MNSVLPLDGCLANVQVCAYVVGSRSCMGVDS